jgi:ankyrin repeat protein
MARAASGSLVNRVWPNLSDDEEELPPHDLDQEYLPANFVSLFDTHGSDRPECLSAWLECLPPLAKKMYQLSNAGLSTDALLNEAVLAITAPDTALAVADPRYGRSVLHWAVILAHPALVILLLQRGADVHLNQVDHQGYSVLGCAHALRATDGTAQVIDALLDAGASLDTLAHGGAELLYRKDLTVSLVERLLRFGADVDGGGAFETTPLLAGCGSVDWGAASMLLDFQADIHRRGAFGVSVLHNPRIPVWLAEQFFRRGADVNATDMQGDTPLMLARAEGNGPLVRWLISRGARCDAMVNPAQSALDFSAHGGRK